MNAGQIKGVNIQTHLPEPTKPNRDREPASDATDSQIDLWFADQLGQGSQALVIVNTYFLEGYVDKEALAHALRNVHAAHDTLHTGLIWEDDRLRQKVLPPAENAVTVIEGHPDEGVSPSTWAQLQARLVLSDPMDLSAGDVFRARLVSQSAVDHVLILMMHHAGVDGWSVGIVLEDIEKAYDFYRHGGSPLILARSQYTQASEFSSVMDSSQKPQNEQFWDKYLHQLPEAEYPWRVDQVSQGRWEDIGLPSRLAEDVKQVAREINVSAYSVWLSIFAVMLSRFSDSREHLVGCPTSRRIDEKQMSAVGPFAGIMPVRVRIDAHVSFRQLVTETANELTLCRDHEGISFRSLAQSVRAAKDGSLDPFILNVFSLGESMTGSPILQGVLVRDYIQPVWDMQYNMQMKVIIDEMPRITFGYATGDLPNGVVRVVPFEFIEVGMWLVKNLDDDLEALLSLSEAETKA